MCTTASIEDGKSRSIYVRSTSNYSYVFSVQTVLYGYLYPHVIFPSVNYKQCMEYGSTSYVYEYLYGVSAYAWYNRYCTFLLITRTPCTCTIN